ncbi:MAG: ATP-grasp domain-containing protein [Polyangiaceae bacterium]
MSDRVLLLLPATSYRDVAFVEAADALGVNLEFGCDVPRAMSHHGRPTHAVSFDDPQESCARLSASLKTSGCGPFDAVVAADEQSAVLAAHIGMDAVLCRRPYHGVHGVEAAQDKVLMRARLRAAGLPQPDYMVVRPGDSPPSERRFGFPCVVKPAMLSGSQGVIRADDVDERIGVIERVRRIQKVADKAHANPSAFGNILVERFVDGPEIVVEGMAMMTATGELSFDCFAIFDKPDPLRGPYFEESLFVTPSRHPVELQEAAVRLTTDVARTLGLTNGPLHAEIRLSDQGPVMIEVAARSIGGLCSRVFTGLFGSLEQRILSRMLGRQDEWTTASAQAAGVMMIPLPRSGVLVSVDGVEAARALRGVDGIVIAAQPGDALRAQPEGNRYLGFIFASGSSAMDVERALREAHAFLTIRLKPLLAIA